MQLECDAAKLDNKPPYRLHDCNSADNEGSAKTTASLNSYQMPSSAGDTKDNLHKLTISHKRSFMSQPTSPVSVPSHVNKSAYHTLSLGLQKLETSRSYSVKGTRDRHNTQTSGSPRSRNHPSSTRKNSTGLLRSVLSALHVTNQQKSYQSHKSVQSSAAVTSQSGPHSSAFALPSGSNTPIRHRLASIVVPETVLNPLGPFGSLQSVDSVDSLFALASSQPIQNSAGLQGQQQHFTAQQSGLGSDASASRNQANDTVSRDVETGLQVHLLARNNQSIAAFWEMLGYFEGREVPTWLSGRHVQRILTNVYLLKEELMFLLIIGLGIFVMVSSEAFSWELWFGVALEALGVAGLLIKAGRLFDDSRSDHSQ